MRLRGPNRLSREAAIKTDGQRFCRHFVQLQIAAQLLPCWSGYCRSAFDRQYDDAVRVRLTTGIANAGDSRLLGLQFHAIKTFVPI